MTLTGGVDYARAYYHCPHCHHGWFPTDDEMGIAQKKTPGCREVVSLTGDLEPFAEAADRLLTKLTGLNLSASTVQRVTEAVGQEVAQRRAAGETLGPVTAWDWNRDARGQRVAYVGLDATSVPQQGPHGEKADGRMPWVGSVFNPEPMHERDRATKSAAAAMTPSTAARSQEPSPTEPSFVAGAANSTRPPGSKRPRVWPTRYVSGVMTLEAIGRQLRGECQAVGIANADAVVCLTDGGNGLETCLVETVLSGLAREIVLILDFFHASEHLKEFAKLWEHDEATRREQLATWCHTLKHQGGTQLLANLESLDLTPRSAEVHEAHRQLANYVRNNQHRMNYPEYITRGWEIGSGEIESACKGVVNHRLKGPGMRWHLPGTTSLCQLRALYKSEPTLWQTFWTRTAKA